MRGNSRAADRYTSVAVALHWLIALLIIGNVAGALAFDALLESADPADKALGFQLIQLHKASGLTVLTLSVARLLWRLANPPPALPGHMAGWEKALARATHIGFYALMIGVPLLGWAMVSASPLDFPIQYFGLFEWPQLPIATNKALADQLAETHELMAFATMGVLVLHVAGALKHQLVDRDGVLGRMVPWARRA